MSRVGGTFVKHSCGAEIAYDEQASPRAKSAGLSAAEAGGSAGAVFELAVLTGNVALGVALGPFGTGREASSGTVGSGSATIRAVPGAPVEGRSGRASCGVTAVQGAAFAAAGSGAARDGATVPVAISGGCSSGRAKQINFPAAVPGATDRAVSAETFVQYRGKSEPLTLPIARTGDGDRLGRENRPSACRGATVTAIGLRDRSGDDPATG